MATGVKTLVYPVKDVARARALYTRLLGVAPYVDEPYYVGFRIGDQEVGLDPNGHTQGLTGGVPYLEVDDLDGLLAKLVEDGATVQQAAMDVGGGRRIARVADLDGNVVGLLQDGVA